MNYWMPKMNTRQLVIISLMIALEVLLTRFLSIQMPTIRISYGFLPLAVTGMMFGPVYAGLAAVIGDLIGITLVPAGPFFPGFTLTALLTGVVYGLLLYRPSASIFRICCAAFLVCIPLQLCLDTVWLWILTGKGYLVLLPPRVLKAVIMVPIQIFLIYTVKIQVLDRIFRDNRI